jgi:hypothetical protein
MLLRALFVALALIVGAAGSASNAEACIFGCCHGGGYGHGWHSAGYAPAAECWAAGHCAPAMVESTAWVPTYSTEKRTVTVTQWTAEPRTYKYTVMKPVYEKQTVKQSYTVLEQREEKRTVNFVVHKPVYETHSQKVMVSVPAIETRQQQFQVQVPVWKQVEQTYQVMMPYHETHQAVRKVVHCIPVKVKRQVTVDAGHWATQMVEVACNSCGHGGGLFGCHGWSGCGSCGHGGCGTAMVCRRVWVSKPQVREIEVVELRHKVVDHPYTYTTLAYKPVTRSRTVQVCDWATKTETHDVQVCVYKPVEQTRTWQVCKLVAENRQQEVSHVVCVPRTVTRDVPVTKCKWVAEEKTGQCQVMVPKHVQKEVQVQVCHMVAKKVLVPAQGCATCW